MSGLATGWVLQHSEATGAARLVLVVLADHADTQGRNAWPSVRTIAYEARCSESTVHRVLRELEANGDLVREGTTEFQTVRYRVAMGGSEDRRGSDPASLPPPRIGDKPSLEPPTKKSLSSKGRKTSEPSSRSVAREDSVPDDFPDEIRPHARIVHPLLVGLAERKGGRRPSARALASVLMARPTHALVKEAYDCVAWYEDNRATVLDVVASYRNWLDKTQPLAATERLPGEAGPLPQGVTPIRPRNAREQQEADTQRRLAKLRELGYEPGQLGGLA